MIEVVIGCLRFQDLYLVGKRPESGRFPGVWEFPGGKVEEGETHEEALIREWKEECGITVSVFHKIYSHTFNIVGMPAFRATTYIVSSIVAPRALHHEELMWVTLKTLSELITAPSLSRALEEGLHYRSTTGA